MEAEGRRADSWWVESFYTRMDTCPRREKIYGLLARLADEMRNQEGNPHDAGMQRP